MQNTDQALLKLEEERVTYARLWRENSRVHTINGDYAWMAAFLKSPCRILEVGTGIGHSTLALLQRGHQVVGIEENIACLRDASKLLSSNGIEHLVIERGHISSADNSKYSIHYDDLPDQIHPVCTLVESDILNDPMLTQWIFQFGGLNAITCWLLGTHNMRHANQALTPLKVRSNRDYELHVQRFALLHAEKLLASPGSMIQLVDRGSYPDHAMQSDYNRFYHSLISDTNLSLIDIAFRSYNDIDNGVPVACEVQTTEEPRALVSALFELQ